MGFSAGGSGSLFGSSDVALNTPATNNALMYDSAISKWKNANITPAIINAEPAGLQASTITSLDGRYGQLTAPDNWWKGKAAFGIQDTASRNNFVTHYELRSADGSVDNSTRDHIGHGLLTDMKGDWTNDTGASAGQGFGVNIYTTTGTSSGDGQGMINVVSALIETAVKSPAGVNINQAVGLQAEVSFSNAISGAHVTTMRSLNVANPVRKDGATGGTAYSIYGMHLDAVRVGDLGSTVAYTIFAAGGSSKFLEHVEIEGVNVTDRPLSVIGVTGQTANLFQLLDNSTNYNVLARFMNNGDLELNAQAPTSTPLRINVPTAQSSAIVQVQATGGVNLFTILGSGAVRASSDVTVRLATASQTKIGAIGPSSESGVMFTNNATPTLLYADSNGALKIRNRDTTVTDVATTASAGFIRVQKGDGTYDPRPAGAPNGVGTYRGSNAPTDMTTGDVWTRTP